MPEAPPRAFPGSSPHTRGARLRERLRFGAEGIIPAYAGSTLTRPRPSGCRSGSSPHTRGAPVTGSLAMTRSGIIPAYAGSTAALAAQAHSIADHPRIRGEHLCRRSFGAVKAGSSPHTRGARQLARDRDEIARIIPAYAGSTFPSLASTSARRDHPRIRGEHIVKNGTFSTGMGSSPHTRGAPI